MCERGNGHGLHVVGRHVVAPVERCTATRELEQRERATRRRADLNRLRVSGRGDDVDHVEADRLRDVDLLDRSLHLEQRLPVDERLQLDLVLTALGAVDEHQPLVLAGRIADRHAQQEAVELRLGERIGALVLDRVLRREHEERRPEPARLAFDRHLAFLHRLEQRRLGLRRGAVDLVGEQEVREDRTGAEFEVGFALVEDRRAGHVRRHQVGRELDAREVDRRDLRERASHQRLRQPRVVLDQDVAVREHAEQQQLECVALADHRLLDLVQQPVGEASDLVEVHVYILSRSETRARRSFRLMPRS